MKALNISGGATKISGLFGVIKALSDKGFKPSVITGVSAGSLLSLPWILGKHEEIFNIVTNFNLDTFFNKKPVRPDGSLTTSAKWRFLKGCNSLGEQENIRKLIKSVVSEDEFIEYVLHNPTEIYVGAVDFATGKRKYFRIKNCTYEGYINAVMASSAIPGFIPPVEIDGGFYYDGGVRDHVGTGWALEAYPEIKECLTVFSRPKDFVLKPWEPKGFLSVIARHEDIRNVEISKNDESEADFMCKIRGIKHDKFYLPSIMNSLYDVEKRKLRLLYSEGYKAGSLWEPTNNWKL